MSALDDFVFAWFNERQPTEMRVCLDAFYYMDRDTDGSPKGTDPQGLDGEAATAGAEGIAQRSPA